MERETQDMQIQFGCVAHVSCDDHGFCFSYPSIVEHQIKKEAVCVLV